MASSSQDESVFERKNNNAVFLVWSAAAVGKFDHLLYHTKTKSVLVCLMVYIVELTFLNPEIFKFRHEIGLEPL